MENDAFPTDPFVLHGTWTNNQFFLWVETSKRRPQRKQQDKLPLHPFSAPPALLRQALRALIGVNAGDYIGRPAERVYLLPTDDQGPLLPAGVAGLWWQAHWDPDGKNPVPAH